VRQSNILIISFAIFMVAFLGYSLWQSNTSQPLAEVSKEQQESDMKMAEKFLHNAEPERSLPIIHKYKDVMETSSSEGDRWLELFVQASSDLNDTDQLLMIYQFKPEIFKNNEKAAFHLARIFYNNSSVADYDKIKSLWKGRESNSAAWTLLDADMFLIQGHHQQAYELLKNEKWTGSLEKERLMRLAMLNIQDHPQEALNILNAELSKDPKNAEILLFRSKIYESQQKLALAEKDLTTAVQLEPRNIYLQDQLAEFYRRQKNYAKALNVWQKLHSQSTNDQIWVKTLFWNYVSQPTHVDWKKSALPEDKSKAFLVYMLNLKPGQFWDSQAFEKIPHRLDFQKDYQAAYWLRLLQSLKMHHEREAFAILRNNPFQDQSWAPLMEITLKRILNFRSKGSFRLEEDDNAEPVVNVLTSTHLPTLYKEIDTLAQKEVAQGSPLSVSPAMQALLTNQEIFPVLFMSEGWTEAALQMQPVNLLSADFPDWTYVLYINGIRQNRGNQAALKFLAQQKPLPILSLLASEIYIAEGKSAEALPLLEKLKNHTSDIGTRAVWLLASIYMQNNQYSQAKEMIQTHPQLSQTLQGQEALGRIAAKEGDLETAAEFYKKITQQSCEAKSFLARRAYQEKDWAQARSLTEDLLNDYPENLQLQDNLKKIIANEEIERKNSSRPLLR